MAATATMLASGSLCAPPHLAAHNLASLSFSRSPVFSPSVVKPRVVSADSGAFPTSHFPSKLKRTRRKTVESKKTDGATPPTADTNFFVRVAWYGSEAFGKAVSAFRPKPSESPEEETFEGPVERKYAVELLRADLDRSYFVNGNMATGIYENDCEFADPFVSFKGLKRFRQNVGNLGSFMEESSLKVLDFQEYEDRIYAKWRFNCVIALPWRPILAASGSTEYFFSNNSGKIYKHVESWDISPADGLRQLFKPNPKQKS